MKVATWNVNSITARIDQVVEWCENERPDVLCLQELKCTTQRFPARRFRSAGLKYEAVLGERGYNGVAIVSRKPLEDVEFNLPDDAADPQSRLVAATVDGVRIVNVYAPHGTKFGSDRFRFKLEYFVRLRRYFDERHDHDDDLILCGDLNVAPHELDIWNPLQWQNKMHFSKPEREAIQDLKKWGFVDVFRQINGGEREYSWWSNFHNDFEKDRGMRLDHIWASPALAELCTDCWIDKRPRASDKPSDHAPVVAEFAV
jgi:exodeoxyribonuclease-3